MLEKKGYIKAVLLMFECLAWVHLSMAVVVLILGIVLLGISFLFCLPKDFMTVLPSYLITIVVVDIAIEGLFFMLTLPFKKITSFFGKSEERKDEEKALKIIENNASSITKGLRRSIIAKQELEEWLESIPQDFKGEDSDIIDKTIVLIYNMVDSLVCSLDTKELAESLGLDESYSNYFDKAFKEEGLSVIHLKDSVTFYNIINYGISYAKILKNLEDREEGVNTELLKKLYNDTEDIAKRLAAAEEIERKKKLKRVMEEAKIDLKRLNKLYIADN